MGRGLRVQAGTRPRAAAFPGAASLRKDSVRTGNPLDLPALSKGCRRCLLHASSRGIEAAQRYAGSHAELDPDGQRSAYTPSTARYRALLLVVIATQPSAG